MTLSDKLNEMLEVAGRADQPNTIMGAVNHAAATAAFRDAANPAVFSALVRVAAAIDRHRNAIVGSDDDFAAEREVDAALDALSRTLGVGESEG